MNGRQRLVEGLREFSGRAVRHHSAPNQYAVVIRAQPLAAEMIGHNITLDDDDLIFGQWARKYDQEHGIDLADTLVLVPVESGDYVVVDVISPDTALTSPITDGSVTLAKLAFDPATQAELDAHKASADHDSRYFTETESDARFLAQMPVLLRPVAWMGAANLTTVSGFVGGKCNFYYIGRAPAALSTCDVVTRVATALGGGATYAEVAVFKGTVVANGTTSLTRVGFTDVIAVYNATGIFKTTVALSGVSIGDDLWVCFGSSAIVPFQLRAGLADDIQSGAVQSASVRPSLASTPQATSLGGVTDPVPWFQVKV